MSKEKQERGGKNSARESIKDARKPNKKDKFNEDDRKKFLQRSTSDREFRLSNTISEATDGCKTAWVVGRLLEKFIQSGWRHIQEVDGKQVKRETHSTVSGKEIHYAMEIPMEWWLEKEQINEQKRKNRRQQMNVGIDSDDASTDDGQFFKLDEHKVAQE